MTDTTTAPHPVGTLQHIDPTTLAVDRNVRKHVHLDRGFKSSIKQRGVLQPPTAYWDGMAGAYQVLDGQRRVLAARDAKLPTIPVVIVDPVAAEEQRIVDQLAANEHRAQLADVDKINAYGELSLFGMSSDAIQRRTNLPEALIEKGIRVSKSKTAAAVVEKHPDLGLEEAVVFAEFEDDEEAIAALDEQLKRDPTQLQHAASRIRNDRALEASRQALAAELSAKDIEVVKESDRRLKNAWHLRSTYTGPKLSSTATLEAVLEAGAVVVAVLYQTYQRDTTDLWTPHYYVIDAEARGFYTHSYNMGKPPAGSLSEEEKAARRVAKENTNAWRAATAVRLEFVRGIYRRKELPLGATLFSVQHLLDLLKQQQQSTWITLAAILEYDELDKSAWSAIGQLKQYIAERPHNAAQIMLATAFAVVEGGPDFESKGWSWGDHRRDDTVAYLELLQMWGYTLSEIEQHVVAGTVPA